MTSGSTGPWRKEGIEVRIDTASSGIPVDRFVHSYFFLGIRGCSQPHNVARSPFSGYLIDGPRPLQARGSVSLRDYYLVPGRRICSHTANHGACPVLNVGPKCLTRVGHRTQLAPRCRSNCCPGADGANHKVVIQGGLSSPLVERMTRTEID